MFRVEKLLVFASAPEQKAEKSCSMSRKSSRPASSAPRFAFLFFWRARPKKKESDEGRLQNIFFQISYHTQNGGQYNFILFHARKAISRARSRRDERPDSTLRRGKKRMRMFGEIF
jgi:hypothetical protein